MKKLIILLILLIFATSDSFAEEAALTWEITSLSVSGSDRLTLEFEACRPIPVGTALVLPARSLLLPLTEGEEPATIEAVSLSSVDLGRQITTSGLSDNVTSDSPKYAAVVEQVNGDNRRGWRPIEVAGVIQLGGLPYAELLAFPVTLDCNGRLWFHHSVQLTVSGRVVSPAQLRPRADLWPSSDRLIPQTAVSDSPEYLVITSQALADALQRLVTYKNETGFATELQLIEDILSSHEGRDDAERLRNHLRDFHAAGGRYVLLAGDETILPIRYAYPNDARTQPDLDFQQICDLYFADLTGDWDTDNDGLWGEKYSDRADLTPELLVGRLPINHPDEATNYVDKLVQYETDPGAGDRGYLERAFFFASDQMRDYGESGQHRFIGSAYPDWFEIDTSSAVELTDGADPAPTNPDPSELAGILSAGFGIINVIAHGRSDGFVLKSSGYNEWPKTYLLTDNAGSGHGRLDSYAVSEKPSFYYSLACDNGGFDMDQPPFDDQTPNLAQELVGERGGAVGLIAYSRWGWISSSYLFQKAFFDSLFAHPERTAVEALYASKAELYYYRDLVYGLNYFGDPTLRVYTRKPRKTEITADRADSGLDVMVTADGNAAPGCSLVLSENGSVIGQYVANVDGELTIDYPFDNSGEYKLSSLVNNATVAQLDFIPALITSVEDDPGDDDGLPIRFALRQNYPNPFNPTTVISFELPQPADVRLTVFNVLGQTVTVLTDSRLPAGSHRLEWHGTNQAGNRVAGGVYFYRLETRRHSDVKKMVLLK